MLDQIAGTTTGRYRGGDVPQGLPNPERPVIVADR